MPPVALEEPSGRGGLSIVTSCLSAGVKGLWVVIAIGVETLDSVFSIRVLRVAVVSEVRATFEAGPVAELTAELTETAEAETETVETTAEAETETAGTKAETAGTAAGTAETAAETAVGIARELAGTAREAAGAADEDVEVEVFRSGGATEIPLLERSFIVLEILQYYDLNH